MNDILDRDQIANEIKQILNDFDDKCRSLTYKKGIYIYGSPGCGKTLFVNKLLKELNYDVIQYDAGDVRNKSLIDTITCNNISNKNVLHMMKGEVKKIAIVMDEIDGMNCGDKGGLSALVKLIRQKKTKKQKMESVTLNPIICIGNYYIDKKIKELMKVCNVFELKPVTPIQISNLLINMVPQIINQYDPLFNKIVKFIQGDFRKFAFIQNILQKKPELLQNPEVLENIFHMKSHNDDSKKLTKSLINKQVSIQDHIPFMNETERTIVALLFHENIIDPLFNTSYNTAFDIGSIPNTQSIKKKYDFYNKALENICFADYIDRITFQNQIWIFNEMSSLIKVFHNNHLYHTMFPELKNKFDPPEVRFTKVLTKYSTEYNNQLFIYNISQAIDMDKKDVVSFFQELRLFYKGKFIQNDSEVFNQIEKIFKETTVTKLDIKRMFRYLDKNVKQEDVTALELDDD
jgi:DNA polymerase III delta prime subunit